MYGAKIQDQNNCQRIEGILDFVRQPRPSIVIIQAETLPLRTSPTLLRVYMRVPGAKALEFAGGEIDRKRQNDLELP